MDKLIFSLGMAGSLGGVFLFLYQGIMYLMHNAWSPLTLYSILDNVPAGIQAQVDATPWLFDALQKCPLFAALIVVGLILVFIGKRLSGRYVN